MKLLLQRVNQAQVLVEDVPVGSIGRGILLFLGVEKGDCLEDVLWLVEKVINLRIFEDDHGKMNESVLDVAGEVLVVSQFTLAATCTKGRRPSFDRAEDPEKARHLYNIFIDQVRLRGIVVESGTFQAEMQVCLINDGPVTFFIDTLNK